MMYVFPFVDIAQKKNCYNIQARCYGMCERCGCCADDALERCKNRIRYLERELEENINFDRWFDDDPDLMALQKKNVESNIKHIRKKLARYKQKLKELEMEKDG